MKNIVIFDCVRSPFGRFGGGLRQFHTVDSGAMAISKLIERNALDAKEINAVYFGTASSDARCPNPGRYASLKAGIPYETSAVGVEMQCGTAIAAMNHATELSDRL